MRLRASSPALLIISFTLLIWKVEEVLVWMDGTPTLALHVHTCVSGSRASDRIPLLCLPLCAGQGHMVRDKQLKQKQGQLRSQAEVLGDQRGQGGRERCPPFACLHPSSLPTSSSIPLRPTARTGTTARGGIIDRLIPTSACSRRCWALPLLPPCTPAL